MAIENAVITNSVTTILMAPPLTTYASVLINFCNTGALDEVISIYVVKSGDFAGDNNMVLKNLLIPAGATFELNAEKFIIGPGDKIAAIGTTGGLVTATVSFIEV